MPLRYWKGADAMAAVKNYVTKTFKLDRRVAKRLEEYADRTGRTMTWVIEKAVPEWLDRMEKLEEEIGEDL